jgi:hypothetical protein
MLQTDLATIKMNRLTICLLMALLFSVVMGTTVAFFQQRTITALRRENHRLLQIGGGGESIALAEIPGRYRWIKDGVDSGIITLNADNTVVGATGRTSYGDQQYRWFYQGGQLLIAWGDTHMRFPESSGPGNFSGKHNNKPVQLIREP